MFVLTMQNYSHREPRRAINKGHLNRNIYVILKFTKCPKTLGHFKKT